jgi:uncharacterized membrane protein YhaH (DUF805 family)
LAEIGSCAACGRVGIPAPPPAKSGYFGFSGRISRKEYWLHYTLPLMAASVIGACLDQVLFGHGNIPWISSVLQVVSFYLGLAASCKRAHDRGRSAWFLLIMLIPVVGAIWMFIEFGFLRGTVGTNRFGTDPVVAPTSMAAVPA